MVRTAAAHRIGVGAVCLAALLIRGAALPTALAQPPASAPAQPAARAAAVAVPAPAPAYQIILRSRTGTVVPTKKKEAQTGGGFIQVIQLEPNAVLFVMRGAVVAGPHHAGAAQMQLDLKQDFEIIPTRAGALPPRLVVSGWLIGTLQSQTSGGGTAEQGEACARILADGQELLTTCLQPHTVSRGQNLLVNDRDGPLEAPAYPGCYSLQQSFGIRALQDCGCHRAGVAVDFDPDARLDSRWEEVLKPFRAVPHRDFGFRVIVRVVEDVPPPCVVPPGLPRPATTPPPRRDKLPLPEEELAPPREAPPMRPGAESSSAATAPAEKPFPGYSWSPRW